MAVSDPTSSVPTPTGTLQGVAAFSWDGSTWQPAGAAYASVATPTGVLRGVAPFSWDGSNWQPTGRALPGVPTPTGTLDGVALYTWSGSAWTPAGGGTTPTPSGTLQGVAGFQWDGSAWQPAGQAEAWVATPAGVLQGVALFNWNGAAWTAAGAPSLDLNFIAMAPTLDPRITLSRPSIATYFDATGTMQTAAANVARFDYDPVTHASRGLLIEEQRTNIVSSLISSWAIFNATFTANAGVAPDGTTTMLKFSETTGNNVHYTNTYYTTVASTQYVTTIFAKAAGTQFFQLICDDNSNGAFATFDLVNGVVSGPITARGTGIAGTATIQPVGNGIYRISVSATPGPATTGRIALVLCNTGNPGYAPGYVGNAANGVLVWGAQLEQGAFPTSYIPTTGAAVTRATESAIATGLTLTAGAAGASVSIDAMALQNTVAGTNCNWIVVDAGTSANAMVMVNPANSANIRYGLTIGGTSIVSAGDVTTGTRPTVFKSAMAVSSTQLFPAMNGVVGAVLAGGTLPTLSRVQFGQGGITQPNGYMRRVRYWPRALSAAELQQVTT